jgi:ferredoxin
MIVSKQEFHAFLRKCATEQQVIVSRRSMVNPAELFFSPIQEVPEVEFNSYRTIDPLRSLFYLPRERILGKEPPVVKRLVVGAKACDLKALQLLDQALINPDFTDPCYASWRHNTTIISSDCNEIHPTCHCNLVGGKPYPEEDFDLNLSSLDANYYYLSIGSAKGEEFFARLQANLKMTEPTPDEERLRQANREAAERKLQLQNELLRRGNDYARLKTADIRYWIEAAKTCCGCGGCTNICPTCYCILLNDETVDPGNFEKDKSWDSCQYHGYARVAGGATPRPKMYERFRNRYLCKFQYMPANFGKLGCTGCGRCTEVCAGQIKFAEVVKNIMEAKQVQETAHV